MSTARKPLGRGLSNLLAGADVPKYSNGDSPNYKEIPLEYITANPHQPRKRFEGKELEELAETMRKVGLIEPIVVRCLDKELNHYQLIAGERRFRAAQMAGFRKIPAILKQANDLQALELGIIENIQREELNPVEEARAYAYWIEATKQKPDVLAKKIGKNRSTVTNLLRILKLPDAILELLETNKLTVGQARPLLGIGDKRVLKQMAVKIAREAWTTRKVEDEVARLVQKRGETQSKRKHDANLAQLEKELRIKLTARVQVRHKRNGAGNITIHYGNLQDLDRLLALLGIG